MMNTNVRCIGPEALTTRRAMVELYAIDKVNEPCIRGMWKDLSFPVIVIRLQDLLCLQSGKFNSTYYEICEVGGIHNYSIYREFKGKIILSLVMRDKLIAGSNPYNIYAQAINNMHPDFWTSTDGETYEGEEEKSWREINRCFQETKELMRFCPNSKPIGQVKGCNERQIELHTKMLKSLGIEYFILHVGDFFRHGDRNMIAKAKSYALVIRKHAKHLTLYGMGSQSRILEFSFADAYANFSYMVTALKGKKLHDTKTGGYNGDYKLVAKVNLIQSLLNIIKARAQTKLIEGGVCKWAVDQEAIGLATSKAQVHTPAI